jgi:iron uptake system component EfeO
MTQRRSALLGATTVGLALLASACTVNHDTSSSGASGSDRAFTVSATDDACTVSADRGEAGTLSFDVTNKGDQVTEFYLLGSDGLRILGEVENIGPGLSRKLVVTAPAGKYFTACKPGMKGDGIRDAFTVTGSDEAQPAVADEKVVEQATRNYAAYVRDQSAQLLDATQRFVRLYESGDDDAARALYPEARTHWERIETVAESFGDLDPRMDAREADLEPGQRWTGWHRIEKDLWPPSSYSALTPAQRRTFGQDLLTNTRTLDRRVQELDYTLDQIANGSRGLLEEVATGKVTGEEEIWSHTDLWDFQANVDGARVAYEGVRPVVVERDKTLATTLDRRFAELQRLLDAQREGDGFRTYDQLTKAQVKQLSDAVNALSEPLSRLTGTVVASS